MALLNWIVPASCGTGLARRTALGWVALLSLTLTLTSRAAPPAPPISETEVKADYLFLFTKYVEWPPSSFADTNRPVVVAVLGDDELAAALERRVAGRITQGGRQISVLRARRPADLDTCHIAFIGQEDRRVARETIESLRGRAVLTVCDQDGLFAQGLMIKFLLNAGSVRFEVKLDPVERAKLNIHSGMLGAAQRVWPKSRSSLEPP